MNCNSLYGNYRYRKFTDIYTDVESFVTDYQNNGIPMMLKDTQSINTIFYLLYARYGNSTIASSDENQFKYKLFSTIYMYGPSWEKRLDLQQKLIGLTEDELIRGSTAIYNSALNPESDPSTQTLEEINYINSQNTTKYKRSKLEAYGQLYQLIETDVTESFIGKFKKLFLQVVQPEEPLWYVTEESN